jgi:hypothetical protein
LTDIGPHGSFLANEVQRRGRAVDQRARDDRADGPSEARIALNGVHLADGVGYSF